MKTRLIIAYLLNLFDLYCTMLLVNKYGIEIEGNPIGKFLLETNLAIPVKTIGIGAAMFALYAGGAGFLGGDGNASNCYHAHGIVPCSTSRLYGEHYK